MRNEAEVFSMQEHGVSCGGDTKALSSAWLKDAPEGDHFVGSHGRVFDVIVLAKPGRDPKGPQMSCHGRRAPASMKLRSLILQGFSGWSF